MPVTPECTKIRHQREAGLRNDWKTPVWTNKPVNMCLLCTLCTYRYTGRERPLERGRKKERESRSHPASTRVLLAFYFANGVSHRFNILTKAQRKGVFVPRRTLE